MRTRIAWGAGLTAWVAGCAATPPDDASRGAGEWQAAAGPVAEVPAIAGRPAAVGTAAARGEGGLPPLPDPPVELGDKLLLDHFTPGHFAMVASWHQFSSCSRSYSDYSAQASLVLELREGGAASACRGRETNEVSGSQRGDGGPDVRRMKERQGVAGRGWTCGSTSLTAPVPSGAATPT